MTTTNKQEILSETDTVDALEFTPLSDKYIKLLKVNALIFYVILMLVPPILFILFEMSITTLCISEAVIFIIGFLQIALTTKIYRVKGYAVRNRDITYRSGLFFRRTCTVPFSKIQQVNINQGPVSRLFGLYEIEITNGAQTESSVIIPGLTEVKAESLKSLITGKTDA